jgi:putative SOS response-associated peptidase YedK
MHEAAYWHLTGSQQIKGVSLTGMCNLYSITTNQAAIIALFRAVNHNVGNLPPMPGVFPDYPAPVVRNAAAERELVMMRSGMPPPPRFGWLPVTNIRREGIALCRTRLGVARSDRRPTP